MKVAVVSPEPTHQVAGGLERLVAGLATALAARPGCAADLVTLPVDERDFFALVASYRRFWELDASAYDLVVSCKYPAWMVRHPRHVCYLAHRLRGLYDTYALFGQPFALRDDEPAAARVARHLRTSPRDATGVAELFGLLAELEGHAASLDPALFSFPGPLARRVVHFLDDAALAPGAIERHLAISETVVYRAGYFPPEAEVTVVHPPSTLAGLGTGPYDAFFAPGRLDPPKRFELLVEGFQATGLAAELRIAGDGPDRARLEALAAGDPRIRFLGRIDDVALAREYRHALAVPFLALDEDYGLVAVEAMTCGKPVLTCRDSGGPLKLVTSGATGVVVEPTVEGVAAGLEALADPERARRMGEAGQARVATIGWEAVAAAVLGETPAPRRAAAERRAGDAPRPRIAIAAPSTYPIHPPDGGGKALLFHRYAALPPDFHSEFVSLVRREDRLARGPIAARVREVRIRKSLLHQRREHDLQAVLGGRPATDVAALTLLDDTPAFVREVERCAAHADVLVACQPYLYPLLRRLVDDHVLVYDAQNVEFHLKAEILGYETAMQRSCVDLVREYERQLCLAADLVITYSRDDADDFQRLYGMPAERLLVSRPGYDVHAVPFVDGAERARRRRARALGDAPLLFFLGSYHEPNNEAARFLIELAPRFPHARIVLAGSHTWSLADAELPANVEAAGLLSEEALAELLAVADLALNPMASGSGINLKVGLYFAAGVPVVSTPFGVRGYPVDDDGAVLLAEREQFADRLARALDDAPLRAAVAQRARALVVEEFDREVVVRAYADRLRALVAGRRAGRARRLRRGEGVALPV